MKPRLSLLSLLLLTGTMWTALAQPPVTPTLPPKPPAANALEGTWDLVTVIEDGKLIPMDLVKKTMIRDARIWINDNFVGFVRPDGAGRNLPFVTGTNAATKTIDLEGAVSNGGKGIYYRDGDTLVICLNGLAADPRPTSLVSLPHSNVLLMTFQRVKQATVAPPAPAPQPAPQKTRDEDLWRSLIGTWGHQNDDVVAKVILNPDGTYSTVRCYKRGFKKLFEGEDRTSGTWHVKDGMMMLTTSADTESEAVGQVWSYRIIQISASEMVFEDSKTGTRQFEWKLR